MPVSFVFSKNIQHLHAAFAQSHVCLAQLTFVGTFFGFDLCKMNFPPNDACEAAQHTLLWLWILSGYFFNAFKKHNSLITFFLFFLIWMDLIIARLSICTISKALALSLVLYECWRSSSQVKMWAEIVGQRKVSSQRKAWVSRIACPSSAHYSISKRLSQVSKIPASL